MDGGFVERLEAAVRSCGAAACVGIDPHAERLPVCLGAGPDAARAYGLGVVRACAGVVPAVKPQSAFFEVHGSAGVAALEDVVRAARAAGLLVVLDSKRGDIGTTAEAYARATLDDDGPTGADAVTVSPYLGRESLEPFAARFPSGKGLFVLLRTSNPGAGAWQRGAPGIADHVAEWLMAHPSAGAVVGATLGAEGRAWRERLPRTWFLVPGYGAQGGDRAAVDALRRADGLGALVVSARGVGFPAEGRDGDDWERALGARARAFVREVA